MERKKGAQKGNQNARKYGFYSKVPEIPAPKTKLVCGKCSADWKAGSPAWCPACLTSSFAIAVKQE